jgi:hypothetical protein
VTGVLQSSSSWRSRADLPREQAVAAPTFWLAEIRSSTTMAAPQSALGAVRARPARNIDVAIAKSPSL